MGTDVNLVDGITVDALEVGAVLALAGHGEEVSKGGVAAVRPSGQAGVEISRAGGRAGVEARSRAAYGLRAAL
jgi:hypothetical protein